VCHDNRVAAVCRYCLRNDVGISAGTCLRFVGRQIHSHLVVTALLQLGNGGGLHSFSMALKGGKRGISFVSLDANGGPEKLFRTAGSFAMMKKHADKCAEWVGFGGGLNSARTVDVAFYASYAWAPDSVVDGIPLMRLRYL
jgi:hypothetical protein